MKKVIYYFGFLIALFLNCGLIACSSDDDDNDKKLTVSPESISMHYDETQQLNAKGATNWKTSNDFVADVDSKGKVEARHIGKAQIVASNGKSSATCNVTITPMYTLYDDPILNWGASISTIKSSVKKELVSSNATSLTYKYTIGSDPCIIAYSFKDNKLIAVMCVFDYAYYLQAGYYVLERYQPFSAQEGSYLFADAMNPEKANTIVEFSEYKNGSTTYTSILYASQAYLSSSSRSTRSTMFSIPSIEGWQAEMTKFLK